MINIEDELNSSSLPFVESLYLDYLRDPSSVPESWRRVFDDLPEDGLLRRKALGPSFQPGSMFRPSLAPHIDVNSAALQHRVDQMVRNYRVRGHIIANLDPLGPPRERPPELDPSYYGFTEADMRRPVVSTNFTDARTLGEVIEALNTTYCRSIGAQFMHIDDLVIRQWLQQRMERSKNRLALSRQEQRQILTRLTDAEIFEAFIQKKYIGAKSFSLEGAESLIPLLELAIERAGGQGVKEIVLAMAHRGRLNVLANVMGKNPSAIFREFDDADAELHRGGWDVKYHLGYSSDWTTERGEQVHLSLCFNPSHLEYVNPVALGRLRAKQDRAEDSARETGMALLIHGDASFIGQGVVQESLNLSELPAYEVGGALHVIVNNQVGFTTGPEQGRSTTYASDVAKMLQSPIFHVNGEDPEAVAHVVNLAMDFRREWKRDVVIDMYAYRRHGHNEGDEPSFTQPLMYRSVEKRSSVRDGYLERLEALGGVTRSEADEIAERRREHLENELSMARSDEFKPRHSALEGLWKGFRGGADADVAEVDTGVERNRLSALLRGLATVPDGFKLHPKLNRGFTMRREMADGARPLDWAAGEALAFATLATEGYRVRLTGQDSQRGTFSHRHAVLHDFDTGARYTPLNDLEGGQAPVEICNSPLAEAGVVGFEYGYSLDYPDGLVMWEAQFGDFVNAAQVIVDQFIASGEDKWRRLSGITLLLPHGFEGQGPEHSSARLERFLAQCAEDNMQVANPTTPAQFFHLLRRQVLRPWRKPLVVMTPKSLLRHPKVVSSLDDLATGTFRRVFKDGDVEPRNVDRILLCSGKLYYELAEEREQRELEHVAIVRLEQLYPLSHALLEEALTPYRDGTPIVYVQEEPENMGAWRYLSTALGPVLNDRFPFDGITRPASASPATGSSGAHKLEQRELIQEAFSGLN